MVKLKSLIKNCTRGLFAFSMLALYSGYHWFLQLYFFACLTFLPVSPFVILFGLLYIFRW